MPSINGYAANLKNIDPEDLKGVLGQMDLNTDTKLTLFEKLYDLQREDASKVIKSAQLADLPDYELTDGVWITTGHLSGKLTDVQRVTVGLAAHDVKIAVVIDGKMHNLELDDVATIYTMPIEPEEA